MLQKVLIAMNLIHMGGEIYVHIFRNVRNFLRMWFAPNVVSLGHSDHSMNMLKGFVYYLHLKLLSPTS